MRELIGVTGQYASVDEDLTGRHNLTMIGRLLGFTRQRAVSGPTELLADAGLTDAADRPVKTYSGGMRRRLDLVASLVNRPRVVFLDEPTTGLDPVKRGEMWTSIRALVAGGSTVLLTTQYLDEADALADEIVVFDQGPDRRERHAGRAQAPRRHAHPRRPASPTRPGAATSRGSSRRSSAPSRCRTSRPAGSACRSPTAR